MKAFRKATFIHARKYLTHSQKALFLRECVSVHINPRKDIFQFSEHSNYCIFRLNVLRAENYLIYLFRNVFSFRYCIFCLNISFFPVKEKIIFASKRHEFVSYVTTYYLAFCQRISGFSEVYFSERFHPNASTRNSEFCLNLVPISLYALHSEIGHFRIVLG